MKTVLLYSKIKRKNVTDKSTTNDGKRKMTQRQTRRDGWEAGCPVGFFFPKGALTHHLRNAQHFGGGGIPTGWYPPNRAVRSARRISFSAENDGRCGLGTSRPRWAAFPSLHDQPAGWSWQSVFPLEMQPTCLPNLPPAGLAKCAGRWFASGRLLRETVRIATAPLEPRNDEYERGMETTKGSERTVWQFTTWRQRSSVAGRDAPPARQRPI